MNWQAVGIGLFAFAILCEGAHTASPIVLAWTHPGLRKIALSRPIETLLLPIVAIIGALLASRVPCPELLKPWLLWPIPPVIANLWLIYWVYNIWNVYHFGAQHYGVISIIRRRRRVVNGVGRKFSDTTGGGRLGHVNDLLLSKATCTGVTAVIIVAGPLLIDAAWWRWVALFAINFNHWLVDLGLSFKVSPRWWLFALGVIPIGLIGFLWQVPRVDHIATMAIPWVIQARWGVGIVHFIYSWWVWKLSDLRVRASIGYALRAA